MAETSPTKQPPAAPILMTPGMRTQILPEISLKPVPPCNSNEMLTTPSMHKQKEPEFKANIVVHKSNEENVLMTPSMHTQPVSPTPPIPEVKSNVDNLLMTPTMHLDSTKPRPPSPANKVTEPDANWGKELKQQYLPGYTGHVPDMKEWAIGSSYSKSSHNLAGAFPNKINAPKNIPKPSVWNSSAKIAYTPHSSSEIEQANDKMPSAGCKTETSAPVSLNTTTGSTVDPKQAGIPIGHASRSFGAQTLAGPSDTISNRDKTNHTFVNQMTITMRNQEKLEKSRQKSPTKKQNWPETVGMDGIQARKLIQNEVGSKINVEVIPRGTVISDDLCDNRVRIFVHAHNNTVASAPRIA
eukprot:m.123413 g.123413  ORF g.123413 m.123413 type:complete len:355 (+) comp14446_c0_seq2:133-1197(+)